VQTLLERAQAQNPNVVKLQAQAQAAQADIASARADLQPEVYVRAESQYGSYSVPGSPTLSRFFVGVSSRLGAGLSSLTQVGAAQARFEASKSRPTTPRRRPGRAALRPCRPRWSRPTTSPGPGIASSWPGARPGRM
jgi:hypothetical protein